MSTDTFEARLVALDSKCPWAPEPIRTAKYLIGRAEAVNTVIRMIQARPVLTIHGETGVGKTSLFAGLEPSLESSYYVIRCFEWATAPFASAHERGGVDLFESLLASQVQGVLDMDPATVQDWLDNGFTRAMGTVVPDVTGKRPILILDQFEEFLRTAPRELEGSFKRWIELTMDDAEPAVKVIFSLRSEYQYRLQSLLTELTISGKTDVFRLLPLDQAEDIERVIMGPVGEERPVSPTVVQRLTRAWEQSQQEASPLGLLPLKSMLYSLFWEANNDRTPFLSEDAPNSSPNLINDTYLDRLLQPADESPWDDSAILSDAVLRKVYYHLVDNKLFNCELVAKGDQGDGGPVMYAVVPQILDQICAMRSFLATANFKEYRQLDRLFRDANQATIGLAFPEAPDQAVDAALKRALLDGKDGEGDLLAVLRAEADRPDEWVTDSTTGDPIYGLDFAPWDQDQDREDKTSGPWLGLAPGKALLHLARVFVWAAQWLDKAHICKVTWEADSPSIALFHDQLSDAIRAWGDEYSAEPGSLVKSMVTSPFATLGVSRCLGVVDKIPGCPKGAQRIIANARWTRSQVRHSAFAHLAFVNCDFRNTRFYGCTFEGVAFVNCSLDGTLFEDCKFIGFPDGALIVGADAVGEELAFDRVWASTDNNLSAPKFKIHIPEQLADEILTLRGHRWTGQTWLYSPVSGVAALPLSDEDIANAADAIAKSLADVESVPLEEDVLREGAIGELRLPTGGLAIIGGRVSALMFSNCLFSFENDTPPPTRRPVSALTLAYVGGSSVDFVEQKAIWAAIYGSALRGLSFSRTVESKEFSTFHIDVTESALINTWIGSGIVGEFWAHHSTLQALTSLSTKEDGFTISADLEENKNQQYVAPFIPKDDPEYAPGPLMVRWTGNIEFKTDYRSQPAEAEYDDIIARDESGNIVRAAP